MDWRKEIESEFKNAEKARAKGNEGQARVCARRAAGIAIREYLTRQGIHPPSVSAYDLLNLLKDDPRLSPDLKLIADHLTLRVTKEFKKVCLRRIAEPLKPSGRCIIPKFSHMFSAD
jgi:HEPN domain-containing protein